MNDKSESVPAALLDASREVFERYDRYEKLRELTRHLNGLPDSAPLPEHVKINSVELNYTVNGLPHIAVFSSTELRVGDLYRLLARETDNLVAEIREQAFAARGAATLIEENCSKALYQANAQQAQGPV